MLQEGSVLLDAARRGALPHPTSSAFDPAPWNAAHAGLAGPTGRDDDLLALALFVGDQLRQLREGGFGPPPGLGARRSTILAVAAVNREHRRVLDLHLGTTRRAARGTGRLDVATLAGVRLRGAMAGNDASAAEMTDAIVDALPYLLSSVRSGPAQGASGFDAAEVASRALQASCIERGLALLWQQGLWSDWRLTGPADRPRFAPRERRLEDLRHAWLWRHDANLSQAVHLATARATADRAAGVRAIPELARVVVGVTSERGRPPGLRVVRGALARRRTAFHAGDAALLEASYLGPWLDADLPGTDLTPRGLCRVWWVVADVAEALAADLPRATSFDAAVLGRWALAIARSRLLEAVEGCCEVDAATSEAALALLTYDRGRPGAFRRGLWSAPVVPLDRSDVALCLPVLRWGDPVRRVEGWIRGKSGTGELVEAKRGRSHEGRVRSDVAAALAGNPLLSGMIRACVPRALHPDRPGVGDVDLLVLFGGLLVVGEVKCLVTPSEPIEHHNYGGKLRKASEQARRKAEWVRASPDAVSSALGVGIDAVAAARVVPLVVVNQPFGGSLDLDGVRVVDAPFLRLYLAGGAITTEGAIRSIDGAMASASTVLYGSGAEAVGRFEATMASPPVLERFLRRVERYDMAFPTASGGELAIEAAAMSREDPDRGRSASVLASLLPADPRVRR